MSFRQRHPRWVFLILAVSTLRAQSFTRFLIKKSVVAEESLPEKMLARCLGEIWNLAHLARKHWLTFFAHCVCWTGCTNGMYWMFTQLSFISTKLVALTTHINTTSVSLWVWMTVCDCWLSFSACVCLDECLLACLWKYKSRYVERVIYMYSTRE